MSDPEIFSRIAAQLRPDERVRADLLLQLNAEPAPTPLASASRPRRRVALVASVAAVALVAGLAIAPLLTPKGEDLTEPPPLVAPVGQDATTPDAPPAGDYRPIYAAVRKAMDNRPPTMVFWANSSGGAQFDASGRRPLGLPAEFKGYDSGQHATNTQVAGIDESDVVKSDGHSLFIAAGNEVVIASAAGTGSQELARIDTSDDDGTVQGPVADLMLHGSTLVVLVTQYSPDVSAVPRGAPVTSVPLVATQTRALLYDVSDPAAPKELTSLGQSGAFTTARLDGDVLYLVTQYDLADGDSVDPDRPETFVPNLFQRGRQAPIGVADTWLLPAPEGPRYTVVSSIDLRTGERIDSQAALGGTQHVYLSGANLYLASSEYPASPQPLADYKLNSPTDLSNVMQTTNLARISLADGQLEAAAEASVPGGLLNQFALDEHEGNLRVAVTMEGTTASGAWGRYPALFVLDGSLTVVGSLPQLAVDESIQSVRFAGDLAYVVSFRQIDPLFAIDLSEPTAPKVLSELKIPGFSTYLHPWGEGRLLGLGMDASEQGAVSGLKLSMFDVSDPTAVTEETTLKVDAATAEALSNHKAVLVDMGAGLIGFSATRFDSTGEATNRYLVYRYADGTFSAVDRLPVAVSGSGDANGVRGLTIDGFLYVASPEGVDVYTTDSLNRVAAVDFAKG